MKIAIVKIKAILNVMSLKLNLKTADINLLSVSKKKKKRLNSLATRLLDLKCILRWIYLQLLRSENEMKIPVIKKI